MIARKRGRPRNPHVEEAGRQLGGGAQSRRTTWNTYYAMGALHALHRLGVEMDQGLPLPLIVLYELGVIVDDPDVFARLAATCLAQHRKGWSGRWLAAYVRRERRRQRFALPPSSLETAP